MKKILSLVALAVAAALPTSAMAAQPEAAVGTPDKGSMSGDTTLRNRAAGDTSSMFKELDKDKDGQISKDESKRSADLQARFDAVDTDRNGKVSVTEWNAAETSRGAASGTGATGTTGAGGTTGTGTTGTGTTGTGTTGTTGSGTTGGSSGTGSSIGGGR